MRLGGLTACGAGAVAAMAAGLGWAIARRLTAPPTGRTFDLTVLDVVRRGGQLAVVLRRTPRTVAGGQYNLWLEDGGWVRLGEVLGETGTAVTREVHGETPPGLRPGMQASWSGIYYRDPADAGLDAIDIAIETPAGPAPAWLIESADETDRWAIHIHGLGSPRSGTLRGVEVASAAGFTSLVVSYRNDGEAPTVGTGRSTLGATETDDVRAAVRYAIAHGARRIVLFGWSMGAAIALQLAADSEFGRVIEGLILESPVLDWQSTINANCARAGLPSWFGGLARPWLRRDVLSRLVGLETPGPLERLNSRCRADQLRLPTLILHGLDDTSTPHEVSRRFADLRPDVVRLETFHADHTMSWNSDPERWRLAVLKWLALVTNPTGRRGVSGATTRCPPG